MTHQRKGVLRDHGFVIGSDHAQLDRTVRGADSISTSRIGGVVKTRSEPGQARAYGRTNGRRVFADARGKHQPIQPAPGTDRRSSVVIDAIAVWAV
jgi:hypothetical protein